MTPFDMQYQWNTYKHVKWVYDSATENYGAHCPRWCSAIADGKWLTIFKLENTKKINKNKKDVNTQKKNQLCMFFTSNFPSRYFTLGFQRIELRTQFNYQSREDLILFIFHP